MGILDTRKIYIRTFGCQMNVFDGDAVTDMLVSRGCILADDPEEADIAVYVTCSVRAHAENRVFSLLGRLQNIKRRREGAPLIGVLGCTAERIGSRYLERFPEIDFVVGTRHIDRVPDIAERVLRGEGPIVETGLDRPGILDHVSSSSRSQFSAYVPVSRGCSRRCSYCIVPFVRGDMVSRRKDSIYDDIREHVQRGCVEITLLGQNVDAYGRDDPKQGAFAGLLEDAAAVPGLKRLKFITSHPADFSPDIIRVMQDNPVIAPFFHIPPQSGSNAVLKRMRRGYTREYYIGLIEKIYSALPHASVAGDFIVGFPGETEEDFLQSEALLEKAGFQQAYIFKYSEREGTYSALHMEDTVPREEKKRRNNRLLNIQEKIQFRRHRAFIGRKVDIIVEGPSVKDRERCFGRTDTNFRVVYPPAGEKPGDTVSVEIESVSPLTLFGKKCV